MTATTALTAQNTLGVQGVHQTPPGFVQKQINAVYEDVGVDVVKTGMSRVHLFGSRAATDIVQVCLRLQKRLKSLRMRFADTISAPLLLTP